MSTLKGLASIARGLSAEPPAELLQELAASGVSASPEQPAGAISPSVSRRPLAKTRNQDYRRVMVLIRKSTEKSAYRKWEDSHPEKDFSDLVESLLSGYADGRISV